LHVKPSELRGDELGTVEHRQPALAFEYGSRPVLIAAFEDVQPHRLTVRTTQPMTEGRCFELKPCLPLGNPAPGLIVRAIQLDPETRTGPEGQLRYLLTSCEQAADASRLVDTYANSGWQLDLSMEPERTPRDAFQPT
jgi:hypothetical protein